MATNLHNVHRNFIYRIEAISPTNTMPGKNFLAFDPNRLQGDEASGMTRAFFVHWKGSDPQTVTADGSDRTTTHRYELTFFYSTHYAHDVLHDIIAQDRHDLVKNLQDQSKIVGYDSGNTTTDVGIYERFFISDEMEMGDDVYTYRQQWTLTINEVS
mgnify:CR=1 FL=1